MMANGRKDWDYVSMDDYSKDTKDLADQAAHIIGMQKKEINELKLLLALMVDSAKRIEIFRYRIEGEKPE